MNDFYKSPPISAQFSVVRFTVNSQQSTSCLSAPGIDMNHSQQGEWDYLRMSKRLGLFRFVQMPGSHELMFCNPVGLVEKIILAGRD